MLPRTPAARFTDHIKSLGIPVDGVSGEGPGCRIDLPAEATAEQRETARAAARIFDWNPREQKHPKEILLEVPKLTDEQRRLVLDRIIADYLADRFSLAADVGINLFAGTTSLR